MARAIHRKQTCKPNTPTACTSHSKQTCKPSTSCIACTSHSKQTCKPSTSCIACTICNIVTSTSGEAFCRESKLPQDLQNGCIFFRLLVLQRRYHKLVTSGNSVHSVVRDGAPAETELLHPPHHWGDLSVASITWTIERRSKCQTLDQCCGFTLWFYS